MCPLDNVKPDQYTLKIKMYSCVIVIHIQMYSYVGLFSVQGLEGVMCVVFKLAEIWHLIW